jgi:hypothetical protein
VCPDLRLPPLSRGGAVRLDRDPLPGVLSHRRLVRDVDVLAATERRDCLGVEGLGGALLLTLEQPLALQAAGVAPSDLVADERLRRVRRDATDAHEDHPPLVRERMRPVRGYDRDQLNDQRGGGSSRRARLGSGGILGRLVHVTADVHTVRVTWGGLAGKWSPNTSAAGPATRPSPTLNTEPPPTGCGQRIELSPSLLLRPGERSADLWTLVPGR